jgi:hypothetical protein
MIRIKLIKAAGIDVNLRLETANSSSGRAVETRISTQHSRTIEHGPRFFGKMS